MGLEAEVEDVSNNDDVGGLDGSSAVEFDLVESINSKKTLKLLITKRHLLRNQRLSFATFIIFTVQEVQKCL